MAITILNTEYIDEAPIGDFSAYPGNPRLGDLDAISDSISENGFYGAIVVQKSTGLILAGNHRWLAAKRAGLQKISAILVDVDDEAAKRILLADNRTSDLASFNDEALLAILESCETLTGTGYDEDEVARIAANSAETSTAEVRDLGKTFFFKPVIAHDDLTLFESAMRATGKKSRAEAIKVICEGYFAASKQGLED